MARHPIEHVKVVRSKGRDYYYFNTGTKKNGKPIYGRLPDFSDPGFWNSYASFKAGRTRRLETAFTVAKLAAALPASRRAA